MRRNAAHIEAASSCMARRLTSALRRDLEVRFEGRSDAAAARDFKKAAPERAFWSVIRVAGSQCVESGQQTDDIAPRRPSSWCRSASREDSKWLSRHLDGQSKVRRPIFPPSRGNMDVRSPTDSKSSRTVASRNTGDRRVPQVLPWDGPGHANALVGWTLAGNVARS